MTQVHRVPETLRNRYWSSRASRFPWLCIWKIRSWCKSFSAKKKALAQTDLWYTITWKSAATTGKPEPRASHHKIYEHTKTQRSRKARTYAPHRRRVPSDVRLKNCRGGEAARPRHATHSLGAMLRPFRQRSPDSRGRLFPACG